MNRVGKIVPPKRQILKDITLSFFPGAKIGVLGVNGSGKSTFLKIMAGVDKDIEGEAVLMPGLKIGYLQEPVMNPEQTVREGGGRRHWWRIGRQEAPGRGVRALRRTRCRLRCLATEQGELEAIIAAGGSRKHRPATGVGR